MMRRKLPNYERILLLSLIAMTQLALATQTTVDWLEWMYHLPIEGCNQGTVEIRGPNHRFSSIAEVIVPTATEIAREGHVAGVVPVVHNLTFLHTRPSEFVTLSVLVLKVVRATSRVVFHLDTSTVGAGMTAILSRRYSRERDGLCIRYVQRKVTEQAVVMVLNRSLRPDDKLLLEVATAVQSPRSDQQSADGQQPMDTGLLYEEPTRNSWLYYTGLEFRKARTVCGCFDHVSMKVPVALSVVIPPEYTAVAGSRLISVGQYSDGRSSLWTFAVTPPIAIERLAFAVAYNWRTVSDVRAIDIQLLYDRADRGISDSTYHWLFPEIRSMVTKLQGLTGHPFTNDKLTVIIDYSGEFNIAYHGLIYLNRSFALDSNNQTSKRYLMNQLAQQWFGNMLSVQDWTEYCLPLGMATILSWLEHAPESRQLQETRNNMMYQRGSLHPAIISDYTARDIIGTCFEKLTLVMNMIHIRYMHEIWPRVAKLLFQKVPNLVASHSVWLQIVSEVTNGGFIPQLFNEWLVTKGLAVLQIQWINDATLAIYQLQYYDGVYVPAREAQYRQIPVSLKTNNWGTSLLLERAYKTVVELPRQAAWVKLDYNVYTATAIIYGFKDYEAFRQCRRQTPAVMCQQMGQTIVERALDGFCFALATAQLYGGSDDSVTYNNNNYNRYIRPFITLLSTDRYFANSKSMSDDCDCCLHNLEKASRRREFPTFSEIICNANCRSIQDVQKIIDISGLPGSTTTRWPFGRLADANDQSHNFSIID